MVVGLPSMRGGAGARRSCVPGDGLGDRLEGALRTLAIVTDQTYRWSGRCGGTRGFTPHARRAGRLGFPGTATWRLARHGSPRWGHVWAWRRSR